MTNKFTRVLLTHEVLSTELAQEEAANLREEVARLEAFAMLLRADLLEMAETALDYVRLSADYYGAGSEAAGLERALDCYVCELGLVLERDKRAYRKKHGCEPAPQDTDAN
jgi:hypothetical protein